MKKLMLAFATVGLFGLGACEVDRDRDGYEEEGLYEESEGAYDEGIFQDDEGVFQEGEEGVIGDEGVDIGDEGAPGLGE